MGIETLNTAARAAGFAMATSDEVAHESKAEAKPETETWRSAESVLLSAEPIEATVTPTPSTADWLKSLFGVFGGRAPA